MSTSQAKLVITVEVKDAAKPALVSECPGARRRVPYRFLA